MNLKRVTIMGVIFIFLISFVIHNMYNWYPSIITFMLFPINDTIWEHQKMICMAYLVWGVIEYFILKLFNLYSRNIMTSVVLGSVFNVIIFLLLYIPLYTAFGYDTITTLVIYFLSIIISQGFSYSILNSDTYYKHLNIICFFMIPLIWAVFIYLSFKPFA